MYFTSTNTGIAVGGSGTIRRTTDGGQTWTSVASGTISTLFSITFIDTLTGWIVGDNGLILITSNGGQSWSQQPGGTTNTLLFVNFTSGNAGYAVGFNGTLIKTTVTTGENEIRVNKPVVYPNPVTDRFYLQLPGTINEPVLLNIFNLAGQCLQSEIIYPPFSEPINAGQLPSGIYSLEISSGSLLYREKIIRN